MRIHQIEEHDEKRYELDPKRGAVLKTYTNVQRGGAIIVSHPELGDFEADDSGTFEVPDELGEQLVSQPGWNEGTNPFSEQIEDEVESGNASKAKPRKKAASK